MPLSEKDLITAFKEKRYADFRETLVTFIRSGLPMSGVQAAELIQSLQCQNFQPIEIFACLTDVDEKHQTVLHELAFCKNSNIDSQLLIIFKRLVYSHIAYAANEDIQYVSPFDLLIFFANVDITTKSFIEYLGRPKISNELKEFCATQFSYLLSHREEYDAGRLCTIARSFTQAHVYVPAAGTLLAMFDNNGETGEQYKLYAQAAEDGCELAFCQYVLAWVNMSRAARAFVFQNLPDGYKIESVMKIAVDVYNQGQIDYKQAYRILTFCREYAISKDFLKIWNTSFQVGLLCYSHARSHLKKRNFASADNALCLANQFFRLLLPTLMVKTGTLKMLHGFYSLEGIADEDILHLPKFYHQITKLPYLACVYKIQSRNAGYVKGEHLAEFYSAELNGHTIRFNHSKLANDKSDLLCLLGIRRQEIVDKIKPMLIRKVTAHINRTPLTGLGRSG